MTDAEPLSRHTPEKNMSNHSEEFDAKMRSSMMADMLRERQSALIERFPEGKLTEQDEGAMHFAVGTKSDKVVIEFAAPVSWIGMPPEQAAELANLLFKHARSISKVPLRVSID